MLKDLFVQPGSVWENGHQAPRDLVGAPTDDDC